MQRVRLSYTRSHMQKRPNRISMNTQHAPAPPFKLHHPDNHPIRNPQL